MQTLLLSIPLPVLLAGGTSLVVALLLVFTQAFHGPLSMDSSTGIQKVHTDPTTRVGGIAIVVGVLVAALAAGHLQQSLLWPLLLASIPAFAFGLTEDLTKRVSVLARLLATMACGVLGWAITGFMVMSWELCSTTPMRKPLGRRCLPTMCRTRSAMAWWHLKPMARPAAFKKSRLNPKAITS